MIRLPGRPLSPLHSHQAVKKEAMYAEEYNEFLDDPIEFAIRKYLPRVYGVLKPFEKLPPNRIVSTRHDDEVVVET